MQLRIPSPTVYEVGVGDLFSCKSRQFWDTAGRVVLFEPNTLLYSSLLPKTLAHPNVTLHHVAIGDAPRLGHLVSAGVLSYLLDTPSPINTIFRGKLTPMLEPLQLTVPIMTFNTFDTGDIDVLYLGMEGAEHTVFEQMTSLPHLIILNNHFANDYGYAFPRFEVIQQWAATNGYHIEGGIPDIILIKRTSLANGTIIP